MPNSGALRQDAYQFNTLTAQKDLSEFEASLEVKQADLKLGKKSQDVNKVLVEALIIDIRKISDYLETMKEKEKEVASPAGGSILDAITNAYTFLEDTLKELIVAVKLCQRLEVLANKFGKEEADDVNATNHHLFDRVKKSREYLISAKEKLHELKGLLLKDESAATGAGDNETGGE